MTSRLLLLFLALLSTGGPALAAGDPGNSRIDPRALQGSEGRSGPRAGLRPAAILRLPPSTRSALVVDLAANRAYLLQRDPAEELSVREDLYVSFGKGGLRKVREGDEKTPLGVYYPLRHLRGDRLPPIYGAGALPLDYPNIWDRRLGRTGSGIWIHGSDRERAELPPQVSRGCLALDDADFETLVEGLQLRHSPVLIAETLEWVSEDEHRSRVEEIESALETWRLDWESRNVDRYLSHYAPDFRSGSMRHAAFSRHKRRVNAARRWIRIHIEDLELFSYPGEEDLVLARFRQRYESDSFKTSSTKVQFWRRSPDGWKIVQEGRS